MGLAKFRRSVEVALCTGIPLIAVVSFVIFFVGTTKWLYTHGHMFLAIPVGTIGVLVVIGGMNYLMDPYFD